MPALESLIKPEYPRSHAYDPRWQVDRCMGPNPIWLLEDLLHDVRLRSGMRVLDLGCGLGMTSTFLAREYDVDVVAADHWVSATDNRKRFAQDGVANRVTAVDAEAHALPFDAQEFDAIISIDSYHYFGTADTYLNYITGFLKPGGTLAIAVPGINREIRELGAIPVHVKELVGWEALAWHTAEWWRFEWAITELVTVTAARSQPQGWSDWLLWCEVCAEHSPSADVREGSRSCIAPLETDGGDHLTFALVTAARNQP